VYFNRASCEREKASVAPTAIRTKLDLWRTRRFLRLPVSSSGNSFRRRWRASFSLRWTSLNRNTLPPVMWRNCREGFCRHLSRGFTTLGHLDANCEPACGETSQWFLRHSIWQWNIFAKSRSLLGVVVPHVVQLTRGCEVARVGVSHRPKTSHTCIATLWPRLTPISRDGSYPPASR